MVKQLALREGAAITAANAQLSTIASDPNPATIITDSEQDAIQAMMSMATKRAAENKAPSEPAAKKGKCLGGAGGIKTCRSCAAKGLVVRMTIEHKKNCPNRPAEAGQPQQLAASLSS